MGHARYQSLTGLLADETLKTGWSAKRDCIDILRVELPLSTMRNRRSSPLFLHSYAAETALTR